MWKTTWLVMEPKLKPTPQIDPRSLSISARLCGRCREELYCSGNTCWRPQVLEFLGPPVPVLLTPFELHPVESAALRAQDLRLTEQLLHPQPKTVDTDFHAKSLFGTCVLLSRSAILKLQESLFTLCREIQELLDDIHLRFAGVICRHPPSPLITLRYCLFWGRRPQLATGHCQLSFPGTLSTCLKY